MCPSAFLIHRSRTMIWGLYCKVYSPNSLEWIYIFHDSSVCFIDFAFLKFQNLVVIIHLIAQVYKPQNFNFSIALFNKPRQAECAKNS